jgi:hypothetical protein
MTHEVLPTASAALLNYILAELGPDQPEPLRGNSGLPAAVECLEHNIIVSATPVIAPMFGAALMRCAANRHRDTVLIRHGFHPETIEPVRVDVALRSITGPLLMSDLSFFRHRDGSLHLVPERAGFSLRIARHGVEIAARAPWESIWDRAAGLERAAAQIVRACRQASRGR